MTRFARILTMVVGSTVAAGCGGDDGGGNGGTPQGSGPAADSADCTNEAENPYAEVACLADFFSCFMPTGMCTGEISLTGSLTLTWENGATVESVPDLTGLEIDPENPPTAEDFSGLGANTTISGSGGTCVTGVTELKTDDGCESKTVYTRSADGTTVAFCSDAEGNTTVTCPDGTSTEISGTKGASNCQYGGGNGQCDIKEPELPTGPGGDYGYP